MKHYITLENKKSDAGINVVLKFSDEWAGKGEITADL
jgi:hypothetical protein